MVRRLIRYRIWAAVVIALCAVSAAYYGWRRLNQLNASALEHKTARDTTGTVVRKQHLVFDQNDHSYTDDEGRVFEREPGTEQWVLYYRIDNFDQIGEPYRTAIAHKEEQHLLQWGDRKTTVSKEGYDNVPVYSKLVVAWRWAGDADIEIVSVIKRSETSRGDTQPRFMILGSE
ncbi:MAG TPA: hypothetical protein VJX67_06210 [Blastocatellia bacterium]|nr:hypothetical protein [Blastocatellia bacterium]